MDDEQYFALFTLDEWLAKKKQLSDTLRILIAKIYNDCYGVYGSSRGYQGYYEEEIQEITDAIYELILKIVKK